jgi:hypothetical protein
LTIADGRLQRGDVAHVAHAPPRALVPRVHQALRQGLAGFPGHVHEGDACTLFGKRRHDGGPDAAAATGDEDRAVAQTGKTGEPGRFRGAGGRRVVRGRTCHCNIGIN